MTLGVSHREGPRVGSRNDKGGVRGAMIDSEFVADEKCWERGCCGSCFDFGITDVGGGVSDLRKGSTEKRKMTLTTAVEQNRVGVCGWPMGN